MRAVFFLLMALLLNACSTAVKVNYDTVEPIQWAAQLQQRYQMLSWQLTGRLGIQSQDDSGQLDIIWRQADDDFNIQLNAPLGIVAIELFSQADGVMLRSSDGNQLFADNAESILQQVQGWQLPVSGLRYWLLGVPVPDKPYKLVSWLQSQQLYVMQQDGWSIEFRQYQNVNGMQLPRKVFMHRIDGVKMDVRVVIRHWDIERG